MKKLQLPTVTILGIDCVNVERLQSAMDVSEKNIDFGASKILTSLPTTDSRAIQIPHIDSIEEFSRFCIEELHKYVTTDYVLLIQYDGFVLDAEKWTNDFLKYDYIGGPIDTSKWKGRDEHMPRLIMGNGGFCLRSKKLLDISAALCSNGTIEKVHPEDIALCVWYKEILEKEGIRFAPMDLAMKFSVQYDYGIEYEKPFGFHGSYGKNLEIIAQEHPEFPRLFFMPRIRRGRILRIKDIFEPLALNAYYFGALASGVADVFSRINVFITIPDEQFSEVVKNRLHYYEKVGYGPEIIYIMESIGTTTERSIHSSVLYKTNVGLLQVEFFLYPTSLSFTMPDSKELFGDMPARVGTLDDKAILSEVHTIDHLIEIALDAIRDTARNIPGGCIALVEEYNYIREHNNELLPVVENADTSFLTIETILNHILPTATAAQKVTLCEFVSYMKQIKTYTDAMKQ